MRIHLIAPPQTQTTKAYSLDGFTVATIRFARMMKSLGYYVILYASEENEAPCDELVTILEKEEQETALEGIPYQYAGAENQWGIWREANMRTIDAITDRKQPRDIICTIGGTSQKEIADAHPDLMCVEFSIGYAGSFAPYRVYQSQAWRHYTHGKQGMEDGRFFDAVIPYFFDPEEYTFRAEKEPFALYVGRLTPRKGIGVACEAAKLAGVPLKVIGHGDTSLVTHGAEYLGALPDAERNDYLSRASCLICPTLYLEPFGSVAVEAQLSGTPVISTDFGGFTETVITGWSCNTLGEFVNAIKNAPRVNHRHMRKEAVVRFCMENVQEQYRDYFDRLILLWDQGWRTV